MLSQSLENMILRQMCIRNGKVLVTFLTLTHTQHTKEKKTESQWHNEWMSVFCLSSWKPAFRVKNFVLTLQIKKVFFYWIFDKIKLSKVFHVLLLEQQKKPCLVLFCWNFRLYFFSKKISGNVDLAKLSTGIHRTYSLARSRKKKPNRSSFRHRIRRGRNGDE